MILKILHFQSALALQCFTKYIYNYSGVEEKALSILEEFKKILLMEHNQVHKRSYL